MDAHLKWEVVFTEDLSNAVGQASAAALLQLVRFREHVLYSSVDKAPPGPRGHGRWQQAMTSRDQPPSLDPIRRQPSAIQSRDAAEQPCLSLSRRDDEIVVLLIQRRNSARGCGAGRIELAAPQRIRLYATLAFVHGREPET